MRRIKAPEPSGIVHEVMPRMILAAGLPGTLARALADRRCTRMATRERLLFVRGAASDALLAQGLEPHAREQLERVARIAERAAVMLEFWDADRELAEQQLDQALQLVAAWVISGFPIQQPRTWSWRTWLREVWHALAGVRSGGTAVPP